MTPNTWIDIPGYEGYQVNYNGQVRRVFSDGHVHYLNPFTKKQKRGPKRQYVKLSRNHKGKEVSLTSLIARVFLGPCPEGYMPVHINGDQSDNCAGNIEYISYAESGRRYASSNGNRRAVAKIDREGNVIEIYPSQRAAGKANHISPQAISRRCLNEVKYPFDLDGYNYVFDSEKLYK